MADPCASCSSSSGSVNKELFHAVCQNNPACVKSLLQSGADVNTTDDTGATPLTIAFENQFDEVISILIAAGANVNSSSPFGQTPLSLAASYGQVEWVTALF